MVASSIVLTNSTGARRGLLLTTSLVSSLIMLDSNIVTDIQWVVSAYVFKPLRRPRGALLSGPVHA